MAVVRAEKHNDFILISTKHLTDDRLTLEAKAILTFLFTIPDVIDLSTEYIADLLREEYETVSGALTELEAAGYIEVVER